MEQPTKHTAMHTTHSRPGHSAHPVENRSIGEQDKQALPDAVLTMLACNSASQAAMTLANHLPSELAGARMAVAMLDRRGMCSLRAVTGLTKLDRRTQQAQAMEAALDEAVLNDAQLLFQRGRQAELPAKTHDHLANLVGCRWIVSRPLHDSEGHAVGAWLLLGESDNQQQAAVKWLHDAEQPSALVLPTINRAHEGIAAKAFRSLHQRFDTQCKRLLAGAIVFAIGCLAVLPLRYQVHCDCTIEPVMRRFVAAPFAATLKRTLVEPGDVVRAGDLLAELDGREIRWELAALEADYQQASKGRDTAMAERKIATAQLSRLEMEQLEQRIALMRDRQKHLEIRSPLAGVVVSGDLQRVQGAPLTIGQSLFEIAPLEQVIVEVAVAENEIAYVRQKDDVNIRLDAFARRRWAGRVTKIHPKAELRDSHQVFIAEVELANTERLLRPGMRGYADIIGPRAPVGWILFHRPWESAVRWLGW